MSEHEVLSWELFGTAARDREDQIGCEAVGNNVSRQFPRGGAE